LLAIQAPALSGSAAVLRGGNRRDIRRAEPRASVSVRVETDGARGAYPEPVAEESRSGAILSAASGIMEKMNHGAQAMLCSSNQCVPGIQQQSSARRQSGRRRSASTEGSGRIMEVPP